MVEIHYNSMKETEIKPGVVQYKTRLENTCKPTEASNLYNPWGEHTHAYCEEAWPPSRVHCKTMKYI